ncbi:MAG: cytochrome C [Pseudomonadota bacterium]|nr:cytochrome C [Pseudomonadota bacterium]
MGGLALPPPAHALPAFARQTGQNCVACHAGGQFPELTPYGRMFKITGYTIGARTLPLAIMGVASDTWVANTAKSDSPASDFAKDARPIFATASLFVAGKVTDNVGAFLQFTYDNYASQSGDGSYHGYTAADNMDIRFADHLIDPQRDLAYGFSLNNNPSVSDPWNTAAAWMQYVPVPMSSVPSAYQFIDGNTPYPGYGSGGNIAGLTGYLFWNRSLYLEAGSYRTANGPLSLLSLNLDDANTTHLAGSWNPYWRAAWSHEWGAHNLMVGTSGMVARVYDAGSSTADAGALGTFRNTAVDAQYQYLSDLHTVTVQMAYAHQEQHYSSNTLAAFTPGYFQADGVTPLTAPNASDSTQLLRAKASYVHDATVGGSVALFSSHGSANTLNQSAGFDGTGALVSSSQVNGNLSGRPDTRGMSYELFWLPLQNLRAGLQYTTYQTYNGADRGYAGGSRNAGDNNSLFLYLWGAY